MLKTLISRPVVFSGTCAAILAAAWYWYKKSKKDDKLRVTAINVFPVKSIGGFSVKEWVFDENGLVMDRKWMVVRTKNHKFVTQRECPKMALVQAALSSDLRVLTLKAPGCKDIQIKDGDERYAVEIWNQSFDAIDVGNEAAEWLSTFLSMDVRLVRTPNDHNREASNDFMKHFTNLEPKPSANTSFCDGFPVLMSAEASLKDLNDRICKTKQKPIDMVRFRPNIVVNGQKAYEEDEWHTIRIGEQNLVFYNVKPCTRCTIPNVNPIDGTKDTNVREILGGYRHDVDLNNPIFAINLAHAVTCIGQKVRVGDLVTVDKYKAAPNVIAK
jgi:uncharacterized protein YcbX